MKKKIILCAAVALFFGVNAKAQLQDEKNVTITMDLQPILQLNMQGPDEIDFTFDQISKYYSGITKYGVTTLKVSASVSFDLWAAGLSQESQGVYMWDNPMQYAASSGATNLIPVTALELHQFPANPSIGALCPAALTVNQDYSSTFSALGGTGNNDVYAPTASTPYLAPGAAVAGLGGNDGEKYIAGAPGTTAGCQIAGGTYLQQSIVGGVPSTSGYYFILDYRLLPNLPAQFPFHEVANATNATCPSLVAADAASAALDASYAQPGVYTMYVKYILAEDQ